MALIGVGTVTVPVNVEEPEAFTTKALQSVCTLIPDKFTAVLKSSTEI